MQTKLMSAKEATDKSNDSLKLKPKERLLNSFDTMETQKLIEILNEIADKIKVAVTRGEFSVHIQMPIANKTPVPHLEHSLGLVEQAIVLELQDQGYQVSLEYVGKKTDGEPFYVDRTIGDLTIMWR
jgi:hypothetical protein